LHEFVGLAVVDIGCTETRAVTDRI
jgi:hypothetical protein